MEVTILTGPSGSGNSSAKYIFEEHGYYVVENLPLNTAKSIIDSLTSSFYKSIKTCFLINIVVAKQIINEIKKIPNIDLTVILLNTDKDEIMKRYTLSRHIHPRTMLAKISLEKAILQDKKAAEDLRLDADIYIDTTNLTVKELRNILSNKIDSRRHKTTSIQFTSFGLKNGLPIDIDMCIDTRIIPNPFWVEELKELTGLDEKVITYLNSYPITKEFLDNTISYLEMILENVTKLGRASYNIGVCCSGGQHRSTYIASELGKHFQEKYNVIVTHRDANRLETRVKER